MKHDGTANRVHYASAGAVRRPRPADPARPTGIELNWANLLDNLAGVGAPHLIGLKADADDIEERAKHLRKVLDAVTSYVKAVVGDTRYHAACTIEDETGFLANAASDIVGALRQGATRQAEDDADPAGWMGRYHAERTRQGGAT
jgi:hypothetical protein